MRHMLFGKKVKKPGGMDDPRQILVTVLGQFIILIMTDAIALCFFT